MRNEARRYVISFLVVLLVGVAYAQQSQEVEIEDVTLKDSQTNIQISNNSNDPKEEKKAEETKEEAKPEAETAAAKEAEAAASAAKSNARAFRATAYCLKGRTASGKKVRRGVIAADPRVLPLGTTVELNAGRYTGEYLVADTGGKVKGRKIDIWVPNCREARKWGNRKVKLTVMSKPTRRKK